mgnify:CR=1 FL=1
MDSANLLYLMPGDLFHSDAQSFGHCVLMPTSWPELVIFMVHSIASREYSIAWLNAFTNLSFQLRNVLLSDSNVFRFITALLSLIPLRYVTVLLGIAYGTDDPAPAPTVVM